MWRRGQCGRIIKVLEQVQRKTAMTIKELIFKAYEHAKPKNIRADTAKTRSTLTLCEYNGFLGEQVHVEEKLNS